MRIKECFKRYVCILKAKVIFTGPRQKNHQNTAIVFPHNLSYLHRGCKMWSHADVKFDKRNYAFSAQNSILPSGY